MHLIDKIIKSVSFSAYTEKTGVRINIIQLISIRDQKLKLTKIYSESYKSQYNLHFAQEAVKKQLDDNELVESFKTNRNLS